MSRITEIRPRLESHADGFRRGRAIGGNLDRSNTLRAFAGRSELDSAADPIGSGDLNSVCNESVIAQADCIVVRRAQCPGIRHAYLARPTRAAAAGKAVGSFRGAKTGGV